MGILEMANQFLSLLKIGGISEQIRLLPIQEQRKIMNDVINNEELNDFAFRALNDPTSGTGKGGFGQTGPATLKQQRELDIIAAETDTPPVYAGL